MTEEELRIKLGLDTQELDSGTRRALQNLSNFGQETHKSFLHGDSAAKGFKKTLHEIASESPVLGNALRLAISPVGGMFALAASGISLATAALEKFNQKLDETGKFNAQGTGAKAVSPTARLIQGEAATKAAADAKATGKPAFTPAQSLKRDEAVKHAGDTIRLIQDNVKFNKDHGTDEPEFLQSVYGLGWWNTLKMSFGFRPGLKGMAKPVADPNVHHQEALLQRVEDAQLMLQTAQPESKLPAPSIKGFNWWEGLGLKQAVGMTARMAQHGNNWINGRPLEAPGAPANVPNLNVPSSSAVDPQPALLQAILGHLQQGVITVQGKEP